MKSYVLSDERTLKFIARAITDVANQSGFFAIYDRQGIDIPYASVESSFTGLCYTIKSSVSGLELASVTISPSLSTRPVAFSVKLTPNGSHFAESHLPECLPDIGGGFGLLTACTSLHGTGNTFSAAYHDRGPDTAYEDLHNGHNAPETVQTVEELVTRRPLWNSETGCYLHNLGSRVKRQSPRNFVLISAFTGEQSKAECQQTVYLRFGMLSNSEWVVDYREEHLTPEVVLGIVMAVMADKTWVR